ncbi:MAG: dUTP diphosphatase [Firmicutes bacterium]|nr:dUTP diphosphatase [Bacillota bacterium]MBR3403674.1 dUTP diphosphatase [Bacillota bacterium]
MIARFEKISYTQFCEDMKAAHPEFSEDEIRSMYEAIELPKRATKGSAGYDFKTPFEITLAAGETVLVPTGIRSWMREDYVLLIVPRSGLGFKYRLQLDNSVGVIDSDYYGAANEGSIKVKMTNDSREGKTVHIPAGGGIAQGIFVPYGVADEEEVTETRTGGFGSTDGGIGDAKK